VPDPLGSHESVQLMQEHAATITRKLPFRMAPSTLGALIVFAVLAAFGLSLQVQKIRKDLKDEPTGIDEAVQLAPKKDPNAPAPSTESERLATFQAYRAALDEAVAAQYAAQYPAQIEKLRSGQLGPRTNAGLWFRETAQGCSALMGLLKDPDVAIRREAANGLSLSSNAPLRDGVEALLSTLASDSDPLTREYAAQGVGRLAHGLARPNDPGLHPVSDEEKKIAPPSWREREEDVVESVAPEDLDLIQKAIDALATAAKDDPELAVRRASVLGLAWVQDPRAFAPLAEAARVADAETQFNAGLGLARLGDLWKRDGAPEEYRADGLVLCHALLRSGNDRVRAQGARIAGTYKLPGATQALLSHLDPETEVSWEVRARSAEALGQIYEGQAAVRDEALGDTIRALVFSSESYEPEPAVRWKCAEALQRMSYNPNKWGKTKMLENRERALQESDEGHGH
jgi:HEAT repeat protein